MKFKGRPDRDVAMNKIHTCTQFEARDINPQIAVAKIPFAENTYLCEIFADAVSPSLRKTSRRSRMIGITTETIPNPDNCVLTTKMSWARGCAGYIGPPNLLD